MDLNAADLAEQLEIPKLDLSHQLTELRVPVIPYGSIPRTMKMSGTFHAYVADHKFTRLFANPERILLSGCTGCIEVNPSTGPGVPLIAALFGIYRKRAVSARWQAAGINIAVDLNIDDAVLPYALLGVPEGWASYAVRKHRFDDLDAILKRHEIAVNHSGIPNPTFIVVGGGAKLRIECEQRGWIHVPEHCRLVRLRDKGERWVTEAGCELAADQPVPQLESAG